MKEFSKNYLEILNGELVNINLTRITSEEDFYLKQIVDSVYPVQNIKELSDIYSDSDLCIDVGFGGGFPLLPLAKIYPDKKFFGFEARRKKADAVRLISDRLNINNVKTFHFRIENIVIDRPAVVSLKAVGKIKDFLSRAFSTKDIYIVFYKGPNVSDLEDVPEHYLGYRQLFHKKYELEGTDGRSVIVYKGKNVPRGTQKDLVKASTL
jgi:16S rRNA (guanine527-N7)-methyltransferase